MTWSRIPRTLIVCHPRRTVYSRLKKNKESLFLVGLLWSFFVVVVTVSVLLAPLTSGLRFLNKHNKLTSSVEKSPE